MNHSERRSSPIVREDPISSAKREEPGQIIVRVLKYDGSENRRWKATIARQEGPLIVLNAEFECAVQHHLLGDIARGTRTIEYYWLDRWYNVFRFLADDGRTRLYYCNVNLPPTFSGNTLSYIDLDLDILVQPDYSHKVLDLDEFERHAELFGYNDEMKRQARATVAELISMIKTRQFPFVEDGGQSPSPALTT